MLLLASASPARRRLLEQAAIAHRVAVSGVEEEAFEEADARRLVQRLAEAKATAVRDRLGQIAPASHRPDGGATAAADAAISAVLGCDSLLLFAGEIYGKPRTAAQAVERWRRMAGGWGELLTGHCLLPADGSSGEVRLATVSTRVLFASIEEAAIQAYVASGEPLACAGGFALEGRGGALVERIEGCVSNVIGLSLPLLRRWLE